MLLDAPSPPPSSLFGLETQTAIALPHDRLREVLKKYNRLEK
jgi:hypothetical protein